MFTPRARSPVKTIASLMPPSSWSTAEEYPARSASVFQISLPSALLSATTDDPAPPGLTMMRSPTTSGDSLSPQVMFCPPKSRMTFTVHATFPDAASSAVRSPLAPNAYTRVPSTVGVPRGTIAAIVREALAVRCVPEALPARDVERNHVLAVLAGAERVQPPPGHGERRIALRLHRWPSRPAAGRSAATP